MGSQNSAQPYEMLGAKLRRLREAHRESMAEVSGAVEIDEVHLSNIEAGKDRPTEDILMLLLSHFGVGDDHADEMWNLAGYTRHHHEERGQDEADDTKQRTAAMMIMLDPRVMYSDSVEVISNKQGVIVNFSQTAGPDSPSLTVSRIGMSHEQAKALMGILHQMLYTQENPGNSRRLNEGGPKQ